MKKQVNKSVYLSGVVLRKAHFDVLHALLNTSEIWTQKRLSKELGFSRQYIHRLTKRLAQHGYINVIKIGRTMEYSITRMGVVEYVNSKHPGVRDFPQVRIHDTELQDEFLTERLPVNHLKDWIIFRPKGWIGYRKKYDLNDVGFVTVVLRHEPGTCTLYIEVVTAPTLDEALKKLNTLIVWILEELERKSIYVSNLHEKKSRSYAIVRDPLADISQEYNLTYNGEGFVIDHSHGVPEIEFPTIEKLKEFYALIEKFMNGEIDFDILTESVRKYEEGKFEAEKNELIDNYDEETVLQMIPHKNIKIKDFVDKFENPNRAVDTLFILEKKGKITASQGYMRQV